MQLYGSKVYSARRPVGPTSTSFQPSIWSSSPRTAEDYKRSITCFVILIIIIESGIILEAAPPSPYVLASLLSAAVLLVATHTYTFTQQLEPKNDCGSDLNSSTVNKSAQAAVVCSLCYEQQFNDIYTDSSPSKLASSHTARSAAGCAYNDLCGAGVYHHRTLHHSLPTQRC